MKKVLSFALFTALVFIGSKSIFADTQKEPQKLHYNYFVETDLATDKFSDAFCERLSTKHHWNKVSSSIESDETYTSLFNFKDESQKLWECEVSIKRAEVHSKRMRVSMTMNQLLDS
ncbi:MAG: hypothetical protein IT281_06015 [Ignavibacteria bacterium]|nr:hypothetical protein [Ignavibacteria bacterium]MCC7159072.1 hypothetical protein [Ignavibacteria bacterium]